MAKTINQDESKGDHTLYLKDLSSKLLVFCIWDEDFLSFLMDEKSTSLLYKYLIFSGKFILSVMILGFGIGIHFFHYIKMEAVKGSNNVYLFDEYRD